MDQNKKIFILLTLYLTSLIASNTLGLKLMPFLLGTYLSVSIFFFPFVFMITDVVGQVFGRKLSKDFIIAGFLATFLFFLYNLISIYLPWAKEGEWVKDSYNNVFGISIRIGIASLLAFMLGEWQDFLTFFFFKDKLKNKKFWLSSNLSNIISQFIDTFIFMFVAFYGVYSFKTIILSGVPWWIFKVLMGILYTPLSYLFIKYLKQDYENNTN